MRLSEAVALTRRGPVGAAFAIHAQARGPKPIALRSSADRRLLSHSQFAQPLQLLAGSLALLEEPPWSRRCLRHFEPASRPSAMFANSGSTAADRCPTLCGRAIEKGQAPRLGLGLVPISGYRSDGPHPPPPPSADTPALHQIVRESRSGPANSQTGRFGTDRCHFDREVVGEAGSDDSYSSAWRDKTSKLAETIALQV